MDLLTIFNAVFEGFSHVMWLFLFVPVFWIIKSPKFKGFVGEIIVHYKLKRLLDLEKCILIHDIMLETKEGSTQIDHIIIALNGIWVLETKFHKGWVTGTKNAKTWKQTNFKKKNFFQNPFRQNYKHCKVISEILELPEEHIHNHVVLLGTFKSKPIKELHTKVSEFIKFFKSNQNVVINDIDLVYKKILSKKIENTFKNKRDHVNRIKNSKGK